MKKYLLITLVSLMSCAAPVSTPLPSGYTAPTSSFACTGSVTIGGSLTYELVATTGFAHSRFFNQTKSAFLAAKNNPSDAALTLELPSLEVGTYSGGYANAVVLKEKVAAITLEHLGVLYTSFSDPSKSRAELKVEGNQGGYVWGTFSGFLYKGSLDSIVSGRFACKTSD